MSMNIRLSLRNLFHQADVEQWLHDAISTQELKARISRRNRESPHLAKKLEFLGDLLYGGDCGESNLL